MKPIYSQIIGVGSGHPETVFTNADFEKFLDTSDEWIRTRTGIRARRICDPKKGENTLSMSLAAAKNALAQAGISGEEIECIIVGTVTPDSVMPTTANHLQAALGAKKAFSFDLQAACSGFVYGMSIADQFIRNGTIKTALVIGAEMLSSIVDWRDRSTSVLFGDGAGAAILRATDDPAHSIIATQLYSDGTQADLLCIPHGGSRVPMSSPDFRFDMAKVKMKGADIFKFAVRNMIDATHSILENNKMTSKDIDFFILHQANIRIVDFCLKNLGVDESKTWMNLQNYGNTSAATLPVCLDEAWKAGKVKPGSTILMATFGGGLTWGSSLIRL